MGHGFFERNVLAISGTYRIVIKRYRCPVCGMTTSLIPTFLIPKYQYSPYVILLSLLLHNLLEVSLQRIAARINAISYREELTGRHIYFWEKRCKTYSGAIIAHMVSIGIRVPDLSRDEILPWLIYTVLWICPFTQYSLDFYKFHGYSLMKKIN